MVSLVIEEGLSLVKVSTYRVIVFFNLKVKQKVKAVNHEKDYHDKFSINLKTTISVQRWRLKS